MIRLLDQARADDVQYSTAELMTILESAKPFQLAAYLTFVLTGTQRRASEQCGLVTARRPSVVRTVQEILQGKEQGTWGPLWNASLYGGRIATSQLDVVRHALASEREPELIRLAVWLALVVRRGLDRSAISALTCALRDSGQTLDLRRTGERPLVRRYPTGSISEKLALVLGAVLSLAAPEFGIVSPVIVARSLGFAGGTADKLSALDDFQFTDLERVSSMLESVGTSYSAAGGAIAPADAALYSFRGATGTVDSLELIAASLASKHLALPVANLLLDIQWGHGGYVPDAPSARRLGAMVADLAASAGMAVKVVPRPAMELTGSCIGPAVELWEALAVMGARGPAFRALRPEPLAAQRAVAARVAADLIAWSTGSAWDSVKAWTMQQLENGSALTAFRHVLAAHGVPDAILAQLTRAPLRILRSQRVHLRIASIRSGRIDHIDARRLGTVVNVELGAGSNPYLRGRPATTGVQLMALPGDYVREGRILAVVRGEAVSDPEQQRAACDAVRSAFVFASTA